MWKALPQNGTRQTNVRVASKRQDCDGEAERTPNPA